MNIFQRIFNPQQPAAIQPAAVVEEKKSLLPVESDEDIELKEIRREEAREKRKLMRERLQLDLERKRLENELEIERLRFEKDQIAQKRLEFAQSQIDEFETDDGEGVDADKMLLTLFASIMQKNSSTPQQPATAKPPVYSPMVTEDKFETDFKAYWDNLNPTVQALAKGMADEDLKSQIKGAAPELSEEQLNKAVQMVRVS